jgi:hypothetical protein
LYGPSMRGAIERMEEIEDRKIRMIFIKDKKLLWILIDYRNWSQRLGPWPTTCSPIRPLTCHPAHSWNWARGLDWFPWQLPWEVATVIATDYDYETLALELTDNASRTFRKFGNFDTAP